MSELTIEEQGAGTDPQGSGWGGFPGKVKLNSMISLGSTRKVGWAIQRPGNRHGVQREGIYIERKQREKEPSRTCGQ